MLREYQSEIEKLKQMIEKGGFEGGEVVPSEELLEAERERVRSEYEAEMAEKFSSEQQSKAKMAAEIEELKRDYEVKLKEVATVCHRAIKSHFSKQNDESKTLLWNF